MVVTKREKDILKGVTGILAAHLQPKRIVLFGSRGKGENRKCSDFDFAVEGGKPSGKKQREINQDIAAISGLYKVDIVYMNSTDAKFREIILKTGRVIYEKRN